MSEPHPYNELGRRLLAAVMGYNLGLSSVDYVLRKYVPEVVHTDWAELAQDLSIGLFEETSRLSYETGKAPPPRKHQ